MGPDGVAGGERPFLRQREGHWTDSPMDLIAQYSIRYEEQPDRLIGLRSPSVLVPGEDRLALLTDRAHGFPAIVALQPASCVRKLVAQVSFEVIR